MQPLRIGICGLGTVGQGVLELLSRNGNAIARQAGRPIEIVRIASRTPKPHVVPEGVAFSTDVADVVADPRVDVVVETIGGTDVAARLFQSCIDARKNIVTANKALLAMHGAALLPVAQRADISVGFEAAVAGGIPIIKALREGLAGNAIHWIAGIINGTSNYILTAMADGRDFAEALADAQALGYAEADPTFDVEGIDAAHKLAILAALAFGIRLDPSAVYTEGISRVSVEDIDYAAALGYRIKHLGIAREAAAGIELRVHPTLIPERRLLAKVDGVMNAVVINSDAVGSSLYYGPGAGALPTASAVLADLIDIARDNAVAVPADTGAKALPIGDVTTAYYLRIPAVDEPGVLAKVAQILSTNGISIEAVIQREQAIRTTGDKPWVPVIILTHRVVERAMDAAVAAIQRLDEVVHPITRIRVETLDEHA
ncbi:MAG TPA: homoserine dehydrogenase [Pseudomonadales bacterium]|nr:homoserine dehydrogenase [Pseudomonadales bacterium]